MTDHDHTKYAYHEGTRKLRAIADWISETTYTAQGPNRMAARRCTTC